MIQTHGTPDRARIYGDIADRMERDPISEDLGRATVPMGRGFALWRRFNPMGELVYVETIEGKSVALTRKQADVLDLARTYIDNGSVTMREMAEVLKVAPSTIYRALVKLASYGLIGYLTGRGRWNRTIIFSRGKNDGLDRFAKVAKDKLRQWSQAAERRVSRLAAVVASRYSWKEIEVHGYSDYYVTYKDATLKVAWTVDDLAGIV